VSEIEIGQIELPESQIGLQAGIGFPVRVRAYSRSENPDPILNNISNHNLKVNTGRKLNNIIEKIWDTHLGTYPGNGVLQYLYTVSIHRYVIKTRKLPLEDLGYKRIPKSQLATRLK